MLVDRLSWRHVILYLGATAAAVSLTFFMLLESEPYGIAREFVNNDPSVAQMAGARYSSQFAPFKGYRATFGDRTGEAYFTFNVCGNNGKFDVQIGMEKREGRWVIVKAQAALEGGKIVNLLAVQL